jgi:hypothetical protein
MFALDRLMVQYLQVFQGGIAPYSYTYTNSKGFIISETNISDNLSGGTYTISVSDSNDCVLVSDIEISEPAGNISFT